MSHGNLAPAAAAQSHPPLPLLGPIAAPLVLLTFLGGLWLDHSVWPWGQPLVSLWTWGMLLVIYRQTPAVQRRPLLPCLILATLGEVVLSLVCGLYDYRENNIPLFVPPGHVLLFLLGATIAPRLPRRLVVWMPWLALPWVVFSGGSGADTQAVALYAVFLLCYALSPSRALYATMFMLALLLEIYGTFLGNWTWHPQPQWLGLTTGNPPLCAGVFYCVLDLLVVSLAAHRRPRFRRFGKMVSDQSAPG